MPDIYGRLACKGGWYIYPIDIEVTCPQYIAQAVDTDTRSAIARQFFRGSKEIAINDDGMAEVNGTKLYYEAKGKGDDLVLLHDGLLVSRIWDDQLGSFVRHFKVILYDRRGYGRSEIPKERFSDVRDLILSVEVLGGRGGLPSRLIERGRGSPRFRPLEQKISAS